MIQNLTRYHFDNQYTETPLQFGEIRIVQIGRRYCAPSSVVGAHPHLNWFELTIVTRGTGTITTNDEPVPVKAGDIYLSFPCDVHQINSSDSDPLEYDFFAFFTEDGALGGELEKILQTHRGAESRVFSDEKVAFLIGNAISEFSVKKPFSEELLTHLFTQAIIYVIRAFSDSKQSATDVSDAEVLCFQLMNYIDTHIYSIRNLREIAESFNYNYSYLSTLFKRTTDQTLFEYYQNRKLETARVLILERKKKFGEIADLLNYSSLFSFSKAFKAKYGVSPRELQVSA